MDREEIDKALDYAMSQIGKHRLPADISPPRNVIPPDMSVARSWVAYDAIALKSHKSNGKRRARRNSYSWFYYKKSLAPAMRDLFNAEDRAILDKLASMTIPCQTRRMSV